MTTARAKRLTFEEWPIESLFFCKKLNFEEWQAGPEIRTPYEMIDGIMVSHSDPTLYHQYIRGNIGISVCGFAEDNGLGHGLMSPFDLLICREPLRTRQADVFYVSHARLAVIGGWASLGHMNHLTVAPELTIEIIERNESRRYVDGKVSDYIRMGVAECGLVSLASLTVEVLYLSKGKITNAGALDYGDEVCSNALPGHAIPVADIFGRLLG